MNHTSLGIGFSDRRYAFGALDHGSMDVGDADRNSGCGTCTRRDPRVMCVACADLAMILAASAETREVH